MEIKKSEQADLERGKSTALLMGFVMVLALFYVALEWTQRDKKIDLSGIIAAEISIDEEMVPITLPEKKTVPAPFLPAMHGSSHGCRLTSDTRASRPARQ